jgi:hypothetical protein
MSPAHRFAFFVCFAIGASMATVAHAQDTDACIGANEKAVALRRADKLIEEQAALSTCAASSCPNTVRTSCLQRLGLVGQAIPSIVFVAKDASGHDLAAVKLTIDGAPYADRLDGSAIELDPGEHEFRFEVAGQAPVVVRFVTHQGEQNRRETIVFEVAPVPPAVVPPASPAFGAADSNPTTPAAADQTAADLGGTQRTFGLVVGGVGVAGLVAGAVFGGLSMAAHNGYEKSCGSQVGAPTGFCKSQGVSGESDAATKGTLSTIFFIGGGVATAAGAVLFLTAPKGSAGTQVGIGIESVVVKGRF